MTNNDLNLALALLVVIDFLLDLLHGFGDALLEILMLLGPQIVALHLEWLRVNQFDALQSEALVEGVFKAKLTLDFGFLSFKFRNWIFVHEAAPVRLQMLSEAIVNLHGRLIQFFRKVHGSLRSADEWRSL